MSITPVDEKEILSWINRERKKMGLGRIRKIRKGRNGGLFCPIAQSLAFKNPRRIFVFREYYSVNRVSRSARLPSVVRAFISYFDSGKLPQYKI
jgi:hypothetical protein